MTSAVGTIRRRLLLAGSAAALATARAPLARADGVPLLRYVTGGGFGSSEIETVIFDPAIPAEALPRRGKEYDLRFTFSNGTPQAASLLAAGEADLGTLSCSAFAAGLVKEAFGTGLSVICDNYQDGAPGYATNGFFVLEGSPIKTANDLRGKTVAVNAFGSAVDLVLRVYLKRNNIDPKRDLNMVEVGFPSIGTAIRSGRVDCGCLVLPFEAAELAKGGLRMLLSGADVLGPSSVIFNVARRDYLAQNAAATRAFLADYVHGLAWISDPANRPKVVEVMAALTKLPTDLLDSYVMTKKDYYRAPDGRIDAALIQKPIDALADLGLLPKAVPIAQYVDMSYLPHG